MSQTLSSTVFLNIVALILTVMPQLTSNAAEPADGPGTYLARAEAIVAKIQEPVFPERDFLASDFGALGDGTTDDRAAIQGAIDACSRAGGGRVLLESGVYYLRGPIELKSHVNLHLPEGTHLRFSGIPEDFLPPVLTRWEGTLVYNYSPMIYARHARNVGLTGTGKIDGNAEKSFASWRARQRNDQNMLREMGGRQHPVHNRVFGGGHFLRPSLVQFMGCSRILVDGPTFVDSPFWIIHPVFSEHITIRNIVCESLRLNNDGIDPDSSSYVLIENSTFRVGDDAVAIKSGRDDEGRRLGVPSENIVIRNNFFESVHNGVAIGSEMSGGVRNVYLHGCTVGSGRNLIYFKSNLDRGGIIEEVFVWDIEVEVSRLALIRFRTDYHSHRGGRHIPVFRHFRLEDIRAEKVEQFAIKVEGHRDAPVEDVRLRNISVKEALIPVDINPWDEVQMEEVYINGKPAQPVDLSREEIKAILEARS
ncbi:MAG TPA: glycoside hydrolase family 28 protein [Oceanipulchritudo sp.]|nr:glycoside hydrolase family 28 protein [Oceanipulchritudo sp.]